MAKWCGVSRGAALRERFSPTYLRGCAGALRRAAQGLVGVAGREELLAPLREIDRSGCAGAEGGDRHRRPAEPDPERLVEGVAPRTAVGEGAESREDDRRQLDPAVRVPEAVLPVDVADRVR